MKFLTKAGLKKLSKEELENYSKELYEEYENTQKDMMAKSLNFNHFMKCEKQFIKCEKYIDIYETFIKDN